MRTENQLPFRVASAFPGRIRLQWADGQPPVSVARALVTTPGILDVRQAPDAGSLIIRYDATALSEATILRTVADQAALACEAAGPPSNARIAGAAIGYSRTKLSAKQTGGSPNPPRTGGTIGDSGALREAIIASEAKQSPGDSASTDGDCLVVPPRNDDAHSTCSPSNRGAGGAIPESAPTPYTLNPTPPVPASPESLAHPFAPSPVQPASFALATAAVLGAGVLPEIVVTGAVIAAALPMIKRAVRTLERHRLRMDQLDVINLAAYIMAGDLLTAGQITWVVCLSDLLRSARIRHISQRFTDLLLVETVGRDTETRELVRMIEGASPYNAHIEHKLQHEGDKLVTPLSAGATAVYLFTGEVTRATSVLKFGDIANDVRIAAPAAMITSMMAAGRHGVFIKGARAVEKLAQTGALAVDPDSAWQPGEAFLRVLPGLFDRGIRRIVMAPGPLSRSARRVAREQGLGDAIAAVPAGQWNGEVQALRDDGIQVAVLGDGTGSMCRAAHRDVRIQVPETAAKIDEAGADVFLLHGDTRHLPFAIDRAREAMAIIAENRQLVAVPTGIGIIGSILGITSPVFTTVLHHGASAVAGLNALRPLVHHERLPKTDPGRLTTGGRLRSEA